MTTTAVSHAKVRTVRILIVDDHAGIRRIVRSTLEQHHQFEVVDEAYDGAKAIQEALKLRPDAVVMNVSMPVMNGFDAARGIKSVLPETAIVILSSEVDQRFIAEAVKVGARAYVSKSKVGEDLVNAVEKAARGDDFVVLE